MGRFDLLIIACLVNYALLTLADSQRHVGLLIVLPMLATLVIAQRATRYAGAWLLIGRATVVVGAVLVVVGYAASNNQVAASATMAFAIAMVISLVAVYVHVLTDSDASYQTMYAALSCYLLVGLVFALGDGSLAVFTGRFFTQSGPHVPADYPYFSFVTMTTVGYGDLTPAQGYPRSMAVLEAVIGQMVLVTLVARTVASVSHESIRERRIQRELAREERRAKRRGGSSTPDELPPDVGTAPAD